MTESTVPKVDNPMYLCKDCYHNSKKFAGEYNCKNPQLPINLVTGDRVFPCVVVRGYDTLCGPMGSWFTPLR